LPYGSFWHLFRSIILCILKISTFRRNLYGAYYPDIKVEIFNPKNSPIKARGIIPPAFRQGIPINAFGIYGTLNPEDLIVAPSGDFLLLIIGPLSNP
jgi:hypothetical protein